MPRSGFGLLLIFLGATLVPGCNALFGIVDGKPRPICVDATGLLIDDMEDGYGDICELNGRHGGWYVERDDTPNTQLTPEEDQAFLPTLIGDQQRGTSQYAARFLGEGFKDWGALMGFNFDVQGGGRRPYDADTYSGIAFWMKSNRPVSVNFLLPETDPQKYGGLCDVGPEEHNCNNHYAFAITAPAKGWAKYSIPFDALRQDDGRGTATWNPSRLLGVQFVAAPGAPFEVWIDDLSFIYGCGAGCSPTCSDPLLPVGCPAAGGLPSRCWREGTDCAVGCNLSNTNRLTDTGWSGGDTEADWFTTDDVNLHVNVTGDAELNLVVEVGRTSTEQVLSLEQHFHWCADVSPLTGLEFPLHGAVSGCAFAFFVEDSPHVYDDGSPLGYGLHGRGPRGAQALSFILRPDQITTTAQTVMVPFASLSNGTPATPFDASQITGIGWKFVVEPATAGGQSSCVADVSIGDVRFY